MGSQSRSASTSLGKTTPMLARFASSRRSLAFSRSRSAAVSSGEGRAGNQLSGVHGVTLTRLQGRSTSRPRNGPTPRLSLICRFPAALISLRARGRSGFVLRPMGVTFPDRAAKYRLEWGAVRLMEVPPTSIAGLAGTSRSRTTRAEDQLVTRRLRAFFLLRRPRGTVAVLCLAT
jgi:hypothetical protein